MCSEIMSNAENKRETIQGIFFTRFTQFSFGLYSYLKVLPGLKDLNNSLSP